MKKFLFFAWTLILLNSLAWADATPGNPAPDFSLTDTNGKSHSLSQYKGKYVVLEWNNPDCPFVKKHYSGGNMQNLQKSAAEKGAVWLTINSSAPGKQGNYSAEQLNEMNSASKVNSSAYLLDSDGKAGRAYGAKTTPHLFVINPEGTVIYAGAIDDKASTDASDIASSKNYVQAALEEDMAGKDVSSPATQSYGCSVKY